jgi:uncharacterized protein YndB with AHSA1/START domain
MTSTTSDWPPPSGLSTPIVSRNDAILTSAASMTIAAPANLVFSLLLATADYPKWNSWVPRVSIQMQPDQVSKESTDLAVGTSFTFHVVMDESKPNKVYDTALRVTDISTPEEHSSYIPKTDLEGDSSYTSDLSKVYRVAWKVDGGWLSSGMKSERFHEVIVLSENECEMRTWEIMGGILARTVKWTMEKTLEKKFSIWCRDVKKAAESRQSSST